MTEHLPECPKSGCPGCYEQGQRDERKRVVLIVENYYKVAPKAAEKLLSLIKETETS
jgi:hypothetical protein